MSALLGCTGEGHRFMSEEYGYDSCLRLVARKFDIMEFERSNNNATFGDRSGGHAAESEGDGPRSGSISKCANASTKRPWNFPRSTNALAAFAEFGIVLRMFVYSCRCRR
jgi:hypothetical protein